MTGQSKHNVQPHIYGAEAQHYRQGTAIATLEQPPCWNPNMMEDHYFPYTLEEWHKDINRWIGATKVASQRHGPLLALSLGDAARQVADNIDTNTFITCFLWFFMYVFISKM